MRSSATPLALATAASVAAAVLLGVLTAGAAGGPAARPSADLATPRPPPYRLQRLPVRISSPVYVAAPPSARGRIYVVQRAGLIRIVSGGRLRQPPFLDLRGQVRGGGEQGMFSVAFHPRFGGNGLFYVCYTDLSGAVVVSEFRSSGDQAVAGSQRVLVRVPHDDSPYHNGGQIAFGPDGRLYVGIGDGGYLAPDFIPDPHGNAQNLNVLLGKIFALDVGVANPQPQLVAYGLRNPWRFSRVPRANAFVVADVGWNSAEEVNYLRLGRSRLVNFGWSVYEGRSPSGADSSLNRTGELTWPIHTYQTSVDRNCSITGGFVYRGSIRAMRGRYVFGDYCSGRIWSLRIVNGRAREVRRERVTVPGLSSFGEDARGELYAVSLGLDRVYRFVRR